MKAGREYGRVATMLNAGDSMAHAMFAFGQCMSGEHEGAMRTAAKAVALNPNNSWAQGMRGGSLAYSGYPGEAIPYLQQAMRLSPVEPLLWVWSHMSATAYFFHGDYEAGLAAGKDLVRAVPNAVFGYRHCLATLVGLGRMAEAAYYADTIYTRFPKEIAGFMAMQVHWGEWREADHAIYVETLAKGGLVLRDGVLGRVAPLLPDTRG